MEGFLEQKRSQEKEMGREESEGIWQVEQSETFLKKETAADERSKYLAKRMWINLMKKERIDLG